jgi:hypothetical protein
VAALTAIRSNGWKEGEVFGDRIQHTIYPSYLPICATTLPPEASWLFFCINVCRETLESEDKALTDHPIVHIMPKLF